MVTRNRHPIARKDLIISELADEALIYNFADHHAHCVSRIAMRVFKCCDGTRSVAAIVERLHADGFPMTGAEAQQALGELAQAGLIEHAPPRRRVELRRRRALGQLALTAGLSVAVPMVWSIVAPSVAEAASTVSCVFNCTDGNGEYCGVSGFTAGVCVINMMGNPACRGVGMMNGNPNCS